MRFVEVTLTPFKFVNEMLVDVRDCPFAVPNARLVANAFVEEMLVNTPVEGVDAPIGVLLMVPPSMVKPLTTKLSVTELVGSERTPVTAKLVVVALVITSPPVMVPPSSRRYDELAAIHIGSVSV